MVDWLQLALVLKRRLGEEVVMEMAGCGKKLKAKEKWWCGGRPSG